MKRLKKYFVNIVVAEGIALLSRLSLLSAALVWWNQIVFLLLIILMREGFVPLCSLGSIMLDILDFISSFSYISFAYIVRSYNEVTYRLASFSCSYELNSN